MHETQFFRSQERSRAARPCGNRYSAIPGDYYLLLQYDINSNKLVREIICEDDRRTKLTVIQMKLINGALFR